MMVATRETLGAIQEGVRDYLDATAAAANAVQSRAIIPPVKFDIGFNTAGLVDEPVIGYGNDVAGEDMSPN